MSRTEARGWLEAEAPVSSLGREFLAYWHDKCPDPATGGFPTRAEIVPEEILKLLPYVFMIDVLGEGAEQDFRFRLVGTAIVDIEGEHPRKLPRDLFPDREASAVLWRQNHDAAAGKVWVRHETLGWQGRDHVNYEVILAPLQDEQGRVTILIGLAHAPQG
ncbi:MAG: PAS domain-containing protein [Kiloniellaceae bacterium]